MLRLTLISLAFLVCAANANLFGSLMKDEEKAVIVSNEEEIPSQPNPDSEVPSEETGLAVIDQSQAISDLMSEGQSSGVMIRAKRYYGCGCGCCGCVAATVDPAATMAPCGCGCCGCGYG